MLLIVEVIVFIFVKIFINLFQTLLIPIGWIFVGKLTKHGRSSFEVLLLNGTISHIYLTTVYQSG